METQLKSKCLLVKSEHAKSVEIVETPLQPLQDNQVVIRVRYVSIIHYDLMKISGNTGAAYPFIPCVELSGVIEQAKNKELIGKKAAYMNLVDGCCRSRIIANLSEVFILNDEIDLIKASIISCNPFTAYGIVDTAIGLKCKGFGVTAGNSSVGKMIYRIAKDFGITCIPIVRSENRKKEMENEGFENVMNSSDDNFVSEMNKLMIKLEAHVIMDTLAGSVVGKLMKSLPKNGIMVNFGTQTHEPYSGIDATDMRWGNKEMKNFLVGPWLLRKVESGEIGKIQQYILKNFETIFKAEVGKVFDITEFQKAHDHMRDIEPTLKAIIKIDPDF